MKITKTVKAQVNMMRDKLSGGTAPIKATDLLTMQHREVDVLFARIEKASDGREKRALLGHLANNLAAHMLIEQEIFYPACKKEAGQSDMIFEAFEEHGVSQFELERLLATSASDPSFDAKLTVLRELIHHHVGEEESELFKKVERALGRERLVELGGEMKTRFERAVEQGHEALSKKIASQAMRDGRRSTTTGTVAGKKRARSIGGTSRGASKKASSSRKGGKK